MNMLKTYLPFIAAGFLSGLTAVSLSGCDKIAEQCQLTCPKEGILQGNASISGITSIDSFFAATIDVRRATLDLESSLRHELLALASALKIETPSQNVTTLAGQVKSALSKQFSAKLDGSIAIGFVPPRCEADFDVAVEASGQCDVDFKPGKADFSCSGSCAIEASASAVAKCEASGTLRCQVTAPSIKCEGTCAGTCQLEAAANCNGACQGSCEGSCSACIGGECKVENGKITNCAGTCTGDCSGSCEMSAGAKCEGKCEGSCEYNAPKGGCEADAVVRCQAKANAKMKVDCKGKCEGSITPPSMKAECKASVEARARADVKCTPPRLDIDYSFKASLGDKDRAEFRALINVLRIRFSAMLALDAKAGQVVIAAKGLAKNAEKILGDAQARIKADVSFKTIRNVGCAVKEGRNVAKLMGETTKSLQGTISAVGKVKGSMQTYTYSLD